MKSAATIQTDPKDLAEQFISDVESGVLPSCKFIKQAVARHKTDLKEAGKRGFWFDEAAGMQAIELFSLFRHTSGQWATHLFKLQPWQAFLLYCLFGWKKNGSNLRRFTRAYVEVAKKNGKSELAGGIGILGAFFDNEYGAEVYSMANKLEQASISWKAGLQMAKFLKADYPEDVPDFVIGESFNNKRILNPEDNSFFSPIASEDKTLDGPRPHIIVVDEYHAAPSDSPLRNMESGSINRTQPLVFVITTAGFNRNGPCFQMRKVVADILDGKKRDDSFFGMVFTLDEGDDWEDEKNWPKPNPTIGITPTWDAMRNQYTKAKNEGESARINFLTKNLNVWTTTSSTWIKDEEWMDNARDIDPEELKGRTCYAGLDLASVRDLTALVLIFPPKNSGWAVMEEKEVMWAGQKIQAVTDAALIPDGVTYILPFFWVPEDGAESRSKSDGVPYLQWIADGLIEATPGNVTDYGYVKARILELAEMYKPVAIAYDRFNSSQLVIELQDEGLKMSPFGQGFVSMNAPCVQLERMTLARVFAHDGNPVLRWMCGNIQLKKDPAGNIKMDKAKSQEKIDGMVALAMAIGEWMTGEKPAGPSKYETEGLTIV